ncbi:MAG: SAM-dependent methyltransferase [Proteobacteria bacterium]|nr:SAM-dependent methyltransferase [Pseudomonadota bacterium]
MCNYHGPFLDKNNRLRAKCPKCGELERARLAKLVINHLYDNHKAAETSVLHISPENFLRKIFKRDFRGYISADLYRKDVDKQFDIQKIPYPDHSFDLVFASHVLEYVEDDRQAIAEIKRVLRPGGLAMLPVPMLHEKTIDFSKRPENKRIIRETGEDYFDRYRAVFSEVTVYNPRAFDQSYNLTIDMTNEIKTNNEDASYQIPNLLPVCKL